MNFSLKLIRPYSSMFTAFSVFLTKIIESFFIISCLVN